MSQPAPSPQAPPPPGGGLSVSVAEDAKDIDTGTRVAGWLSGQVGATGVPFAAHLLALADRLAADRKYRSDLLRDLISGRIEDPERHLPGDLGLRAGGGRLLVVVAEPDPEPSDDAAALRVLQEAFTRAWTAAVVPRDPNAAVVGYPHEIIVLLDDDDGDGRRLARGAATRVAAECAVLDRGFSTGISRPVGGVALVAGAYRQARRALEAGRRVHGPGSVADFDQLGVFRLLSLVPDSAELERFAVEALGPLAETDDHDADDLRRTLQALLDANLNVAETSRRLYVHYNTLRYRIGKLERVLGPFTRDAQLRLNLMIALQILRMRGGRTTG